MKSIKRSKHRKYKNRILDLHRTKHEDAVDMVSDFLYKSIDKGRMPVKIITGKSSLMREVVGKVVDYMGYMSLRDNACGITQPGTVVVDYEPPEDDESG